MELAGEEDPFAAREAEAAATAIEVVAPGLATARGVDIERATQLAYTRRVVELVGNCDPDVEAASALVEAASIDREGTVAVRARDIRGLTDVSTTDAERTVGSVLVERGFDVDLDDPDHELRVYFSEGTCLVGWAVAESVRDFADRKPTDRPFFQPGSMAPVDARAFVNIAGAEPGARILDPMCGTGGVLLEAGLVGADVVGVDAQAKMARGAQVNVDHYVGDGHVIRGDATSLPLCDDTIDGVVFDAPYGRQSKIARHTLADLVGGALEEVYRVAPQCVMVADRSWVDEAEAAGWEVEQVFERRVHRSLVRHVHILRR
ncbi:MULTISPECIES: TIGR01177 family methyltransferase [Haloferax]|uniref:tRNA (guanine(10)-N(2))-dimethyltransferase n=2 Tax=Haloferax TaxID=2251 RepID=A0A6G1YZE0_9EURY|nr:MULTISPECIES: TIGR01177 family methyltransferase [Haloferax]KAB1189202.1 TIGR01177 family methyltransferase [Haloferax sp. CBA1149]MRW79636.1 TIGR01177 family methyltransferase [Haloferax marinisediminis]